MEYIKQNFENGQTLDAQNLNYIENGIVELAKESSKLSEDKASNPSTGKVGQILEIESVDENGKPKTYKAVNKPTGGEYGVGIQSVEQTTTSTEDGGTNIITVTKTDGTSSTFQVLNGSKGSQGERGLQGIQGEKGDTGAKGDKGDKGDTGATGETGADGKDGLTPHIGSNGNWWIGDTDTGVNASGGISGGGSGEWETICEIDWSNETILATQNFEYTGKWNRLHIISDQLVGGVANTYYIDLYDEVLKRVMYLTFMSVCSYVAEGNAGKRYHAWVEADGNSFQYLQPQSEFNSDRSGTALVSSSTSLATGVISKVGISKRDLVNNQPKSGTTTIYGRKVT